MEKKLRICFEILFVVSAFAYYLIFVTIPQYKEKYGSSDSFISVKKYQSMIELKIEDSIDFAYVIDKNQDVYHLFFFEKNDYCLYNQDIENKSLLESIQKSVEILMKQQYLTKDSSVTIVRYSDQDYDLFLKNFKSVLTDYHLSTSFLEEKSTIKEKVESLDVGNFSEKNALKQLDLYSKSIIADVDVTEYTKKETVSLDDNTSLEFADTAYQKIADYVYQMGIRTLEKGEEKVGLSSIPVDGVGKYYPSENSWYVVKEGKVFAYIEFVDGELKYGYCYSGSMESRMKGECV